MHEGMPDAVDNSGFSDGNPMRTDQPDVAGKVGKQPKKAERTGSGLGSEPPSMCCAMTAKVACIAATVGLLVIAGVVAAVVLLFALPEDESNSSMEVNLSLTPGTRDSLLTGACNGSSGGATTLYSYFATTQLPIAGSVPACDQIDTLDTSIASEFDLQMDQILLRLVIETPVVEPMAEQGRRANAMTSLRRRGTDREPDARGLGIDSELKHVARHAAVSDSNDRHR